MNKIIVEIVRDFDGLYYANVSVNGEIIHGLPELVDYRTLKTAIKEKINFEILPKKALSFERSGRKQYALIQN